MAKFHGIIGFVDTVETEPGIWEEQATERTYTGDLVRNVSRVQNSNSVNNSVVVSNNISIVADPYAQQNFHSIRYAVFMGTKWKIENVDVQYPRLVLTMGGKYNG
jgi:hypothetical protein